MIPPGNEALVAELLGTGKTLPGDCKFAGGSIEGTFVSAHYDCAGGTTVHLELHHPSDAAGAAATTERFAIVPRGAAPPELIDAIARRVREGEGRFNWMTAPTPPAPPEPRAEPPPPRSLEDFGGLGGALAVLFLILVLAAPLAVVAGVVGSYLKALLAPPGDGEPIWTAKRLRLVGYLVLFLVVAGLGAAAIVPSWGMQIDEERDFILSALCAHGKGCPLVGNEMNQLRIKLGPLNRYFLTLCQLVTPDPRFALSLILALHALAAAWLAAAGDVLLGAPFGLLAGFWFGTNHPMLDVLGAASNGAWSALFIVGSIVGTLRWVRGDARGLVLAVTCLAAASQLHGTNLALAPPLVVAAVCWRPPMPRRALLACAAIVGALYSPWLLYQWQTGGSDFALISTSWMVSHGPDAIGRLRRAVPFLGGALVAPLTVVGVAALATGRAVAPSERAAGRVVLLLLAVPLAATLLAGGGWAPRYGVPMIAPGALAAAAGVRMLASLLLRRERRQSRYRLAIGALALVLVGGTLLIGGLREGPKEAPGTSDVQLGLAEQIEAIRILGEHGFGAADLESRVHGASWDRWTGGQVYLGEWLIGAPGRAATGEHVAIVECENVPAGFPSWQQSLASSRGPAHRLIGYRPALAPPRIELSVGDDVFWSSDRAVPFYGQMMHGGDARIHALFDPRLAYPAEFADLLPRRHGDQARKMRLSTTLAPGADDRVIALTYDDGLAASVAVGGAPRHPVEAPAVLGHSVRARYLVRGSERAAGLAIEAVIDLPPGALEPRRVDLYEEPDCETGSGDTLG